MKRRTIKVVLSLIVMSGVILLSIIGITILSQAKPSPMMSVTASPQLGSEEMTVASDLPAWVESSEPEALMGTLLQGNSEDVFYLTAEGTCRRIADAETFAAFGFVEADIVKVDDNALAAIPLVGELTRLVSFDQRLYWVMQRQRWLVNEWQEVINRPDYQGIYPTPLDGWLQQQLPVRLNLTRGMLLRDDGPVYYFDFDTVIPVQEGAYQESDVIDVPRGVLAVYPAKTHLEQAYVQLDTATSVAQVRQGPGYQYDEMGIMANKVMVEGQIEGGNWVLTSYQDQPGWLAADVVSDKVALSLLPVINEREALATGLPQAQPVAVIKAGLFLPGTDEPPSQYPVLELPQQ